MGRAGVSPKFLELVIICQPDFGGARSPSTIQRAGKDGGFLTPHSEFLSLRSRYHRRAATRHSRLPQPRLPQRRTSNHLSQGDSEVCAQYWLVRELVLLRRHASLTFYSLPTSTF